MEKPNLLARIFGSSGRGKRGAKRDCCQVQIEEIPETTEEEKRESGSDCCASSGKERETPKD